MPSPTTEDSAPQPAGIVERLVRDDIDRKRFLKMAGGASAASFGAFVLAACGSSSKKATTAAAPATTSTSTSTGVAGDLAILNYALTLEYLETEFYGKVVASGLFNGKIGALIKDFGRQEATHVEALKGAVEKLGGTPVAKPAGQIPDHGRRAGRAAGLHGREPGRGRVSRSGGQHPEPGSPGCRRLRSTPSRPGTRRRWGRWSRSRSHRRAPLQHRLTCPRCWRRSSRSWPETLNPLHERNKDD